MIKELKNTPLGLRLVLLVLLMNAGLLGYNVAADFEKDQATALFYAALSILLAIGMFKRLNFVRVTSIVIFVIAFIVKLLPIIIFSKVVMQNPLTGSDVTIELMIKSIKLAVTFGLLDYLTAPDTRIYFKQEVTIKDRARRPLFYFGMMGLTAGLIALTLTGWTQTLLVFVVNITQPILMVLV